MAGESGGKICVACGTDCAGRPRVKDPRGRYYCKACYDERRTHANRPDESPGLAPDPAPSMLDELLAAQAAEPEPQCPNCGQELARGSVLCINCGFNLRDGSAVSPIVQTQVRSRAGAGAAAWPMAIGIIAIVLGAGGAIYYAVSFITALGGGNASAFSGLLPIMLSVWHLSAGVGVVRGKASGVTSLRRWAIAKLVVCIICIGVASIAAVLLKEAFTEGLTQDAGLPAGLAMAIFFAIMLWLMAWPVFVLIWLSRSSVKAEVATWD